MIKTSTIVGFLTLLQFIYVEGIYKNLWNGISGFTLMHEDTIMIMHLLTYFIVLSIEQLKEKD